MLRFVELFCTTFVLMLSINIVFAQPPGPPPLCTPRTPILEKFVDPLPDIPMISPVTQNDEYGYPHYVVKMTQHNIKLHRDLDPTPMWVYNEHFPGPMFEIERNTKIHVTYINDLPPGRELLPIRQKPGEKPMAANRTVVHLHGGLNKPQYCGHPLDWIRPGHNYTNYYANQQPSTLLWYHDHAMGITAPNVYSGLVGPYVLRDKYERKLNLPSGAYEIFMVITDKWFYPNGSLCYEEDRSHLGATNVIVNGKVWPYKNVQPTKYRLRILNGSNHHFWNISLSNGMTFWQIGGDGGFIEEKAPLTWLLMGVAERADIIIDFKGHENTNITVTNNARRLFPAVFGPPLDPDEAIIMQFRVGPKSTPSREQGVLPDCVLTRYKIPTPEQQAKLKQREFELTFTPNTDPVNVPGPGTFLIAGEGFVARLAATPALGSTEIWTFTNRIITSHPIHIHIVSFYVLDRAPILPNGTVGVAVPAPKNERGLKDTFVIEPNSVARLLITFGPYTGEYVFHCHLLEHEDDDMMRRFAITPVGPDCQRDQDQLDDCDELDDESVKRR